MLRLSRLIQLGALAQSLSGLGRGLANSAIAANILADFPDADPQAVADLIGLAAQGRRCGAAITRGGEVGINLASVPILPTIPPGEYDSLVIERHRNRVTGKIIDVPTRIRGILPQIPPDQPPVFPSIDDLLREVPEPPEDTVGQRIREWARRKGYVLTDPDWYVVVVSSSVEWAFRGPDRLF